MFLRLHRSLGQFRSDASFPAWLYRITVNVCHDMNRQSQRRAEVDFSAIARTLPAAAADAAEDDERRMEAVRAGLAYLGEKERTAIVLRD
ncbi:MAG TPA: sigma factor, partial [Bryobacteraceae bacterium]|nr:sigma factor [Bryobacteraceae bacterium]